jgi:tyrosine-specific transport protein
MNSKLLRAIAILVTTTIGAGIYAVPFAVNHDGLLIGLIYLIGLGLVVHLIHLLYGEVILRTEGEHQLAGYGEIYLGRIGRYLAMAGIFTGIYGALLAYTIKSGQFISLITNQPYPVLFSLIFFFFVSIIVYIGYQIVSLAGVILLGLTISLIGLIGLISLPHLSLSNFSLITNSSISNYLFPYGIVLFSLMADVAIPEMEKTLRDTPQLLKKAIHYGTAIPVILYLFFSLIVIGVCGKLTSPDTFSTLNQFLPDWSIKIGAIMGLLTMTTAFLSLGYILRKVWQWDFKLSKRLAWILAITPPLLLFLLGNPDFIRVLDLAGALTGGFTGILIILMFMKAKKTGTRQPAYSFNIPHPLLWLFCLVFTLGMLSPFIK